MHSLARPEVLAATAQIRGTAWIGVGGAAIGTLLLFLGIESAIQRTKTGIAVAASLLVLVAGTSILPEGTPRLLGVGVGLLVAGAFAGATLPEDRWNYLTSCAGSLLLAMFGVVVLFPQGEQWSGDLFALVTVPVIALATWLPLAIGTAVGSLGASLVKRSSASTRER